MLSSFHNQKGNKMCERWLSSTSETSPTQHLSINLLTTLLSWNFKFLRHQTQIHKSKKAIESKQRKLLLDAVLINCGRGDLSFFLWILMNPNDNSKCLVESLKGVKQLDGNLSVGREIGSSFGRTSDCVESNEQPICISFECILSQKCQIFWEYSKLFGTLEVLKSHYDSTDTWQILLGIKEPQLQFSNLNYIFTLQWGWASPPAGQCAARQIQISSA